VSYKLPIFWKPLLFCSRCTLRQHFIHIIISCRVSALRDQVELSQIEAMGAETKEAATRLIKAQLERELKEIFDTGCDDDAESSYYSMDG
jgi:hypothetical protein